MGCGSSMDTSNVDVEPGNSLIRGDLNGIDPANIIQEFKELDKQIAKLESACPAPRVATLEAWIEHLQVERDQLIGADNIGNIEQTIRRRESIQVENITDERFADNNRNNQIFTIQQAAQKQNTLTNGGIAQTRLANDILANTPTKDLANLALNIGVVGNVEKASTHEDFFANLSESALHLMAIRYYTEILEHNKVRLKTLKEMYADLTELYINHDSIIAYISGGTYMTRLEEKLDAQLEAARDVRDKLGSALEQWRTTGTLLKACASSATQCLTKWKQMQNIVNPKDKIHAALECRSALQASLTSLHCAHLALPHVEMKYVSQRQILAVKHCNTYMITDIANLSRYEHTSKVLESYESNMSKASTWLHDTFNNTLRKDFAKSQETVNDLAKTLRLHRQEIFTAARK